MDSFGRVDGAMMGWFSGFIAHGISDAAFMAMVCLGVGETMHYTTGLRASC
jgi:uncharacterized protein YgfB (UPF0149 family)